MTQKSHYTDSNGVARLTDHLKKTKPRWSNVNMWFNFPFIILSVPFAKGFENKSDIVGKNSCFIFSMLLTRVLSIFYKLFYMAIYSRLLLVSGMQQIRDRGKHRSCYTELTTFNKVQL